MWQSLVQLGFGDKPEALVDAAKKDLFSPMAVGCTANPLIVVALASDALPTILACYLMVELAHQTLTPASEVST